MRIFESFDLLAVFPSGEDPANSYVINYWGSNRMEKIYSIPIWKAKELMEGSLSNKIALKVTNIEEPNLVSAWWGVFEDDFSEINESYSIEYYVLSLESLIGGKDEKGNVYEGLFSLIQNHNMDHLVARIGKIVNDEEEESFHVFFQVAEGKIHIPPQGSGGGSLSAGKRIPTPS